MTNTQQEFLVMDITPYLIPGAATMAVLGIVYLLFVYWVRRPGRQMDLAIREDQQSTS
jgi:hypothetical protein